MITDRYIDPDPLDPNAGAAATPTIDLSPLNPYEGEARGSAPTSWLQAASALPDFGPSYYQSAPVKPVVAQPDTLGNAITQWARMPFGAPATPEERAQAYAETSRVTPYALETGIGLVAGSTGAGGDFTPLNIADEAMSPAQKLTQLIQAAKPARAQTEILKSEELGRRAARGTAELMSGEGRQAFSAARSQLGGELPKAQFTAPESGLNADDVTSLFNQVRDSAKLHFFEKINTADALSKALSGQIPTRGEMAQLEDVFGPELVEALLSKRSLGAKAWENIVDVANIPRAIVTAFDFSAPFRQGAFLIAHPREFYGGFAPMVKAFASEGYAKAVDEAVTFGPFSAIKQEAGLYLAPLSRRSAALGQHEEAFMSRLVGKVPGIRGSNRAYVTFLNKLRSDVFDSFWRDLPAEARTIENAAKYAHWINAATGRGSLPKAMNGLAPVLNATLFSPRYFVSRLEANGLGMVAIKDLARGTVSGRNASAASRQIAKDYLGFMGTIGGIVGLAGLAGATVETNLLSSDALKIRIGHTRYDLWAGNQQLVRNAANFVKGQRKSPTTGKVAAVPRADVIDGFIRSKLSPIAGLLWDIHEGKTIVGDEVNFQPENVRTQAWNRLVPFVIQDIRDLISEEGAGAAPRGLPAIFGVGTQSFSAPGDANGTRNTRPSRSRGRTSRSSSRGGR